MSNIGKKPIIIPNGVTVAISGDKISLTGGKGNVSYQIPSEIDLKVVENEILITSDNLKDRNVNAVSGLTRANIANIAKGVSVGFEKKLELAGVGYRAQMQGTDLVLSVGFSHPVKIKPTNGITLSVTDNVISVIGIDKSMVGEVASEIRAVRPPEPYKGKGIKYVGERVRRKAGKAAKAAGATK